MKKIRKPVSGKGKLVMSLATAGMLTLGALGTALADTSNQDAGQAAGERRGVFGSVTAKGDKTLTLLVSGGETLVLTVNERTQFQLPGKAGATFGDIGTGIRVAALVRRDTDGLTALKVMPMQNEPQREHRVLTVVEVNGRTLTAQDAQGNQITVELGREMNPDLAGQLTTFIGERSQQSDRFKANAEVKIEGIVERLEAHSSRLQEEAGAETNEAARMRKEQDASKLMDRLEANRQRHLNRLEQVIVKAPLEARHALEQARERFKAQQAEARARFEAQQQEARARFEEMYEARLRALENPENGAPPLDRPGVVRPRPDATVDVRVKNEEWQVLTGTLMSVELDAGTLTVGTRDGSVRTLKVGPSALQQARVAIKELASVRPGTQVVIKYRTLGGEVVDLAFGRMEAVGPKPMPPVTVEAPVIWPTDPRDRMDQEQARARFHEAQAQAWRLFQDQQAQALNRFHANQAQVQAKFLEEQKLALARFQEQNKDVAALPRFQENQKLALARFQEEQAQALKRFHVDQAQAQARFLEEQKLALASFQRQP